MRWMSFGVPITVIGIPVMALWLTRGLKLEQPLSLHQVGEFSAHEKRALIVFASVVALWVTRGEPFGGWMAWFNLPMMGDATVALAGVVAMFVVPNGKGGRLLTWEQAGIYPGAYCCSLLVVFAWRRALCKAASATLLATDWRH